jgi:hypothetical protein
MATLSASRSLQDIRFHYRRGMEDFSAFGLYPPANAAAWLPVPELVPWLLEVHDLALTRVKNSLPRFGRMLQKLGPEAVSSVLIQDLADFYAINVQEVYQGLVMKEDLESAVNPRLQPRNDDGYFDDVVLGGEADEVFVGSGWGERSRTIDAYANPIDPRLPPVRTRIALRSEGVAWVNVFRPQSLQLVRFSDINLIVGHGHAGWRFRFNDWRARLITNSDNTPEWLAFVDEVRRVSTEAGFEWKLKSEGVKRA